MKINQALNFMRTLINALNTHQLLTMSGVNACIGHASGLFQLHQRSFLSIFTSLLVGIITSPHV